MAKRSKASYKAAAKKAAATRKRNAAAKKKRASAKRKTAPRRKVNPKGTVLNGKKVGGRFKTNKGRSPTGRRERALCPDTRTVR